jgi:hypothetical protein
VRIRKQKTKNLRCNGRGKPDKHKNLAIQNRRELERPRQPWPDAPGIECLNS